MDPLLVWFVAWVQWIPQIHLWCDTCWPLVTLVTSCDVIIVVFSNVFDSMATRVWLQVTSPQIFVVTLTLKIHLQFLSKTQDFDISFSLTNLMPQIYWNVWGATCLSQEKILNMQINSTPVLKTRIWHCGLVRKLDCFPQETASTSSILFETRLGLMKRYMTGYWWSSLVLPPLHYRATDNRLNPRTD